MSTNIDSETTYGWLANRDGWMPRTDEPIGAFAFIYDGERYDMPMRGGDDFRPERVAAQVASVEALPGGEVMGDLQSYAKGGARFCPHCGEKLEDGEVAS